MTWDQGLHLFANTGDDDFDRLFELASEWQVKAVSFARLGQRGFMEDALKNCYQSLLLAAQEVNAPQPVRIDYDSFWEEFSASQYPGPGTDPHSRNDPSRVPKKPIPSSGSTSVALPLPVSEEDT